VSKPTVWRWQAHYLDEGVPGPKRSATRRGSRACRPCRMREFLSFLRHIDRAVKKPRDIHLVLDNYATHKTPEVKPFFWSKTAEDIIARKRRRLIPSMKSGEIGNMHHARLQTH